MTTETARPALDYARAILGHLPGWQLHATTVRAIAEEDANLTRAWACIEQPAHAGSVINIQTIDGGARLWLSAEYPSGYEPWDVPAGGYCGSRTSRETITVSAGSAPYVIAQHITRRLLGHTNYLARLDKCMADKRGAEDRQATDETIAAAIRTQLGQKPLSHHRDTEDGRRTFDGPPATAPTYRRPVSIEGQVSGGRVRMKLDDLTPDQARAVIALVLPAQAAQDEV